MTKSTGKYVRDSCQSSTLGVMEDDGPTSEIVKYMQPRCYVFGGAVNKCFNRVYRDKHGACTGIDATYTESMVMDIIDDGYPVDHTIYYPFSDVDNLDMIKFLHSKGCDFCYGEMIGCAIEDCYSDIVIWLGTEIGGLENTYWCALAAKIGDLAMLQVMIDTGFSVDTRSISFAALFGHMHVVEWLRENDYPWDTAVFDNACTFGDVENLEKLYDMGCPWGVFACSSAAAAGNLEALQWVRSRGCPWDVRVLEVSQENGHDAVYQWALANGCPT